MSSRNGFGSAALVNAAPWIAAVPIACLGHGTGLALRGWKGYGGVHGRTGDGVVRCVAGVVSGLRGWCAAVRRVGWLLSGGMVDLVGWWEGRGGRMASGWWGGAGAGSACGEVREGQALPVPGTGRSAGRSTKGNPGHGVALTGSAVPLGASWEGAGEGTCVVVDAQANSRAIKHAAPQSMSAGWFKSSR